MKRDGVSHTAGRDTALDMVLERISGALTIARKIVLPNGGSDAVIIAATTEAVELFGFRHRDELIGKMLSEVHERESILQTRLYSAARIVGDTDAPNSYPARIRRADGQVLWVQKEVEQRLEANGSIWITQNTLLPQDREYEMPKLRREKDIIHEYAQRHLTEPLHIPLDQNPPVDIEETCLPAREHNTKLDTVNNKSLTLSTSLKPPVTVHLPFDSAHTLAVPLRHADKQLWLHECQLKACKRQWWSYRENPQHCPSCGSRLWSGTSGWERRRQA